ncbi:MAG: hypothetical protein JNN11_00895 [Candidatus Doudnabacteria bacterium]|nr:hypothetical protein [Candidatus Doudnabacteria bacterium]
MNYIEKQKFNLYELVGESVRKKRILLLEPEYYSRGLYARHLKLGGMHVVCAENMDHCIFMVKTCEPDLALISPHSERDLNKFIDKLKDLRKEHEFLPIMTIGQYLPSDILGKMMNLGVASHMEKRLSRPKDVVLIIKTFI